MMGASYFDLPMMVTSSSKEWKDGYKSGLRINFGEKTAKDKDAVKFTTSGLATVKVWWVCGTTDAT